MKIDPNELSDAIVIDHYSEHHWVTQAVHGETEAERTEAYRVLQERGMSYGEVRRKAFANDYARFRRKILYALEPRDLPEADRKALQADLQSLNEFKALVEENFRILDEREIQRRLGLPLTELKDTRQYDDFQFSSFIFH
jgi:hypothetical protein